MNKNMIKEFCLKEENKSVIKDFCKLVCSYSEYNNSFVNGYDVVNKINKPIVFYAKTKEDFVSKYLRIYNDLNGIVLETLNEDRETKFSSFEELEKYYVENPNEFFQKEWTDFTSYKWDGESLYALWGDGLYYTNSLSYVIEEIKESYSDFNIVENNEECINELYDYIIHNIQ